MKKIFLSPPFFFFITTLTILTLNLLPLFAHLHHTPPGRSFVFVHNNAQDFFFYQALMNQGANGAWLTTDPYTEKPHQPSFIFAYFLWLGKLSKIFHLSYPLTYHLFRLAISFLFFLAAFFLLFRLKIPFPRLAFFFFLFAEPFLRKVFFSGQTSLLPYMSWWTGMEAIRRAAYLPHHMLGGLLLICSLFLFLEIFSFFWKEKKGTFPKRKLFLPFLLLPFLSFIHPPSLFILLLALPPFFLLFFSFFWGEICRRKKIFLSFFLFSLIYFLTGAFSLFWIKTQTSLGFPWNQYLLWEKNLQFPLREELVGAFGFLFPLALLGTMRVLQRPKIEYLLVLSWFFAPLFFLPLAPKIGLSNIRLLQGVPFLPLAILAALGVEALLSLFQKISQRLSFSAPFPFSFSQVFLGLTIFLFSLFTLPTLSWSLKDQIREFWPIFGNIYLDNRLNSAFTFINQNFPPKTLILSTFYTGNYLPAFTHGRSFLGHAGYTDNLKEKEEKTRKFFENKMAKEEARKFLLDNKITLIFQGPEEKPIFSEYLYPGLLKPIYDHDPVTLYTLSTPSLSTPGVE